MSPDEQFSAPGQVRLPADASFSLLTPDRLLRRYTSLAVLRVFVLGLALAVIHLALKAPFFPLAQQSSGQISLVVFSLILSTSLFGFFWARKRGVRAPLIYTQVALDQFALTAVVYLSGGANSAMTPLLGVTCLWAGYLLGVPGALFAGLCGGTNFSLLVLLIEAKILPSSVGGLGGLPSGNPQAVVLVVSNVLMLVFVALLASHLFERLSLAGGELAAATQRAEKAERMAELGRLSAGLAHEIRNPLSSISGAMQMLREAELSVDDQELCEIVIRESARLEELVGDMMNLARPTPPRVRRFDLSALLHEVAILARSRGRGAQDVRVVLEAPADVEIEGDPDQLRQVVWNLLRNAIQSSESGGETRLRLETEGEVVLHVEDDGVGIPVAAQERLFDAYFTTRAQGTGIGLAVVKRIVEEHGYSIRVFSEEGRGARFSVRFSKNS